MSIERTCNYCNQSTKMRCKTETQASDCLFYTAKIHDKQEQSEKIPSGVTFAFTTKNRGSPFVAAAYDNPKDNFIYIGKEKESPCKNIVLTIPEAKILINLINKTIKHIEENN